MSKDRLRSLWPYAAIFVFALILRGIYLSEIIDQPFTTVLLGDAESYDAWAQEIIQQGWIGERTFYQAPFYPYFLALIYTFGSHDFILVRLVQLILGSASCVLLAGAGNYFFNKRVGLLAGTLLSLYAPALFFDLLIQKAVLGMFFMCALLYLLGKATHGENSDQRQIGVWLFIGMVLACFALVRENALILIPVIGLWLVFYFRKSGWQQVLSNGVILSLGLTVVFFPVTLRNYIVGGEFVLTTSQLGPNFFIGNNKDANGFYRPLIKDHSDWRFERSDAQDLAEQALGRKLTPNEVSDFWLNETLADIRQDPIPWFRLMVKKWRLTWNAVEISDSESIYAHYRYSGLLSALGTIFHFGILCPLAIAGIYLTWRNRKHLWSLYALWFCFAASVTLFFIFARYRHPMAAIMLLFAAAGSVKLYQCVKEKELTQLSIGVVVAVSFAIIVNIPMVAKARMEGPTHFNVGYELEKRQLLDQAKAQYQLSLSVDDSNSQVHNNLGVVAMKQNRPEDALRHFQAAVATGADNWDARVNLGIVLSEFGRKAEAVSHYKQVLRAVPDYNPVLHYNIACFYSRGGQTSQGMAWLRSAVEHGYDNWELLEKDPALDNLRPLPGFAKILKQKP